MRYAICNEIFDKWNFAEECRFIRQTGYSGIEIAPYTLAADPGAIPAAARAEIRRTIEDEGLVFVGLHWLMLSPKDFHVTTPDDELRTKSWNHIRHLIDLCADLGPNGVMVFGSPKQRGTTGGSTVAEATDRFYEGLASVAPHAEASGVTVLIEALPHNQTDVVGTLAEAVEGVRRIGSPAVQTMFDVHNTADETEPASVLIERYLPYIRHCHVNEMDGRRPGAGTYDFAALLQTLEKVDFKGWVSLEVFDFSEGAEAIASASLRYLKEQERAATLSETK